jgi:hypothetical protein
MSKKNDSPFTIIDIAMAVIIVAAMITLVVLVWFSWS